MPLRLFGGRGRENVRSCPACRREIPDSATFCPSCYMVFRAEGTADLREFLQGGRIPSDVYLLRKMQAEDPDLGPVIREVSSLSSATPLSPPESGNPTHAPPAPGSEELPLLSSLPSPPPPGTPVQAPLDPPTAPPPNPSPKPAGRTSVELLLNYDRSRPPAARAAEEVPALFAWMLDHDPVIPNNLPRLEEIHAAVFQGRPAGRLTYEEHILLQVADDLLLHPPREALDDHLVLLALGYRRAAEAYHGSPQGGKVADEALWQMASMATRLRLEAWMYRSRYEAPPMVPGRDGTAARRPQDHRKGK
jgi:hypothetical protein